MSEERVILVDEADNQIGTMPKMEAHYKGILHRAFSVFLFNENDELLIHQRAIGKYHSGGLWTNTCCSHPREGESTKNAALRRLQEEMGIQCDVDWQFSFVYKCELEDNLFEHELDHVFTGTFNGTPEINRDEVMDWRWAPISEIQNEIRLAPDAFTVWFKLIFEKVVNKIEI